MLPKALFVTTDVALPEVLRSHFGEFDCACVLFVLLTAACTAGPSLVDPAARNWTSPVMLDDCRHGRLQCVYGGMSSTLKSDIADSRIAQGS